MLLDFNKLTWFGLIVGFGLISPLTYADEKHSIDLKTEACLEKNDSTAGMKQCTHQAEQWWDAELNRVYKALLSKLNHQAKKQLKTAQQQWLKYRNAEFEAIGAIYDAVYKAAGGGTMWSLMLIDSRVEIVKQRVLILTSYLTDFD